MPLGDLHHFLEIYACLVFCVTPALRLAAHYDAVKDVRNLWRRTRGGGSALTLFTVSFLACLYLTV